MPDIMCQIVHWLKISDYFILLEMSSSIYQDEDESELHLHSGISVNWLMIRVTMWLIQMHKNCKKYCVLLAFTEFDVLSLLGDSCSFTPASKPLLCSLVPASRQSPLSYAGAREAGWLCSRLKMLRASWVIVFSGLMG